MLRQRIVASLTRLYPLYSGCGSLANSPRLQQMAGASQERVWARLPNGKRLLVPLDDYVGRAAFYIGDLDPKVTWVCNRVVRPGDTVLDIGANMGVVTLTLSGLVGSTGVVHAFEPNPRMQELLEQSFQKNLASNVKLHKIALGDTEAMLEMHIPQSNAGAGSLVRNREGDRTLSVPVKTLSSVLDPPPPSIRLVKIDVEGFEEQVLSGAAELFRKCPPDVVLFEINAFDAPLRTHPSFRILRELGYIFLSIPRCTWRMRLERYDPDSPGSDDAHDFIAVAKGARLDDTLERLKVT